MICLQYKGYMLISGKIPQHILPNRITINTIVDSSNYKDVMQTIDNLNY